MNPAEHINLKRNDAAFEPRHLGGKNFCELLGRRHKRKNYELWQSVLWSVAEKAKKQRNKKAPAARVHRGGLCESGGLFLNPLSVVVNVELFPLLPHPGPAFMERVDKVVPFDIRRRAVVEEMELLPVLPHPRPAFMERADKIVPFDIRGRAVVEDVELLSVLLRLRFSFAERVDKVIAFDIRRRAVVEDVKLFLVLHRPRPAFTERADRVIPCGIRRCAVG